MNHANIGELKGTDRALRHGTTFALQLASVAFLFCATACSTTISAALSDEQIESIDALVESNWEAAKYPGLTILVRKGQDDVYARAIGHVDIENNLPAKMDSVYAIGSITKSFTALSILMLVEDGKLALTDKISSVLPDYEGPGADATITQLLSHTSGIPNYLNEIPSVRGTFTRRASTRVEMRSYFENESLLFEPGSRWSYSNSGYYILGLIIEKVSGRSFYEFLKQNVFAPFNLHNTYIGDDSEIVPNRARGYELAGENYVNGSPWHFVVPFSAGSLLSTVSDIANYRQSVFQSRNTSPRLRQLVTQSSSLSDGTPVKYTLGGLVESDFHGHRKYSHSGEIYGFFSDHAYYPESDITIVVLTNRRGASPSPVTLERKVARVILGISSVETLNLTLPDDVLRRYSGDFQVGPVLFGPPTYGFVGHDGRLFLKFGGVGSGANEIPLLAQGDGRFVMPDNDEWSFQFDDSDGSSASFQMTARDATIFGGRTADSQR